MKASKIILSVLLIAAMLFTLCSCSDSKAPDKDMQSTLPGADSGAIESDDSDAAETPDEINKDKEIAESLIGREVSELYDAIGEPAESSYASSCLGSGEDGELHYDGFTVYTYREANSEIIQNVL